MKLYTMVLILFLLPSTTLAVSEEPVELIRTTTERILDKLAQAPELKSEPDTLKRLVEESIVPSIDFVRLSGLTLGKHWRTATTEQRKRFTSEFKRLLKSSSFGVQNSPISVESSIHSYSKRRVKASS